MHELSCSYIAALSGNAATDERTIDSVVVHVQRVGEIGGSAWATGQVAPTTAAGTVVAARETRKHVTLVNGGSVDVYVGPATVTTSNGRKLTPGVSITLATRVLIQGHHGIRDRLDSLLGRLRR